MTVKSTSEISSEPKGSIRRRAAYSLAAGAVVAGATTDAQAEIVYSGLQNISINQFSSLPLDMDLDSFTDIRLKNYVFGGGNYQGATIPYAPGQVVGFITGLAYVSALSEGDLISDATTGPTFFGSMAYGGANPNAEFNNVTNAYIGLGFLSGGDVLKGWVRVDVNNATGSFIVKDWAYEDSGSGILAGAIPEPGTLGMMAAGALGVAALRRKRRQAS